MLKEPNPEFTRNLWILTLSIVPVGNKIIYMGFFTLFFKKVNFLLSIRSIDPSLLPTYLDTKSSPT